MIGLRRKVSSLVVPLAKTNSTTTTPCPCAFLKKNPPFFSFVRKSLPSAPTFAPTTQPLNKRHTKLRVCISTDLALFSNHGIQFHRSLLPLQSQPQKSLCTGARHQKNSHFHFAIKSRTTKPTLMTSTLNLLSSNYCWPHHKGINEDRNPFRESKQ